MERRPEETVRTERTTEEVVAGGGITEAIGGCAGVVLGIVGLAGVFPSWMASIAAIVVGAALMLRGLALTARYYSLLSESGADMADSAALGSGIGAEVFGGSAVVILGILALVGVAPLVLLPVSVIVLGATLLLGCGSNCRLNNLVVSQWRGNGHAAGSRIAGDILSAANGAQALVGVGVIVLGIVGLVNHLDLTLCLVGFLASGASILLSGGTLTGRAMTMLSNTSSSSGHHHRRLGHI
jgi:hypothetical protein